MNLSLLIACSLFFFQSQLSAIEPCRWEGHQPPEEFEDEIVEENGQLNLEKMSQKFVLETKEIKVPGFSLAFNPSIIRWKDSILLSFRIRNEKGISTFEMGLVWLDKEFNPISIPQVLEVPPNELTSTIKHQDPRLVTIKDRLYIVYSNILDPVVGEGENRRMFFAEVLFDGDRFFATTPSCLTNFEGEKKQRWEKNWAPFDYKGNLLLAYSILPHLIFYPHPILNRCDTIASSSGKIDWNWGILRGGTAPTLEEDQYLGFFHSCKNMPTIQSNGKNITHYFFGAYTFSAEPPFNITQISPKPILAKTFYTGPFYNTWKPLRVVFPCGHISDEKFVWVAYGKQDHECWVAKLDKKQLMKSLIPVETQ